MDIQMESVSPRAWTRSLSIIDDIARGRRE